MADPRVLAPNGVDATNGLAARMFAGFAGPVFLIDGRTRKVADCNQAALDAFGYSRNELVGRRLLDHFQGEEGRKLASTTEDEAWRAYATSGVYQTRIAYPTKAGTLIPCYLAGISFFSAEGKLDAIIATLVDRSREVEREAELSRLTAEVKKLAGGLAAITQSHPEGPKAECLSALGFTPRQIEILRLAFSGASSKEIGSQLCIAESTVKNHLSSIYRKLGAKSKMACMDLLFKRRIRIE